MSQVWQDADAEGGKLLLLLALADHAGEDGICWPSAETLAHMARISVRHTRKLLGDLEAEGQIEVVERGGGRTTNRYRVVARSRGEQISGVRSEPSTPDTEITPAVIPTSPEPSRNHQEEPSEGKNERKSEIEEVWDYYVRALNANRMTLDDKRRRTIRNALKVRTAEECKRAIDGLKVSEHHNGGPDGTGTKYLDIRYALHGRTVSDDAWIDQMIELAEKHGSGVDGGIPRDSPRVKRWLENVRYAWSNGVEKERGRDGLRKLRENGYDVTLIEGPPKRVELVVK